MSNFVIHVTKDEIARGLAKRKEELLRRADEHESRAKTLKRAKEVVNSLYSRGDDDPKSLRARAARCRAAAKHMTFIFSHLPVQDGDFAVTLYEASMLGIIEAEITTPPSYLW